MDEQIVIRNDKLCAKFSSLGAELISLKDKNDKEYIWQNEQNIWSGHAPICFPICGGLKDDKFILDNKEYTLIKHGFARKKNFTYKIVSKNEVVFELKSDNETFLFYPFKFIFQVDYLLNQNKLIVKYNVINCDTKEMLFSCGGHEAYALYDKFNDYSIVFDKQENLNSYNLIGNLLDYRYTDIKQNTKELNLDYKYFTIDALSFIDLKSRKVTLYNNKEKKDVLSVYYEGFDTLFLWTKPNAKYICIEPWAGMPDRIDSDNILKNKQGIIKIDASKSCFYTHTIEVLNDNK